MIQARNLNMAGVMLGIVIAVALVLPAHVCAQEAQFLKPELPGGFTLKEDVKFYDAGNLYEYINGQAVFYLSYRFKQLEHGYYARGDASFYVDVYELGSDLSAFGAFRQQREQGAPPLDVGAEGAAVDYLTVFHKGVYYVEIIPMSSGGDDLADMKKLAEAVAANIPGSTTLPDEVGLFPSDGLIDDSERYVDENLISYSFMGRGLVAKYETGADKPMRLFISFADSDAEASSRFDEYKAKLNDAKEIAVGEIAGLYGSEPYRGTTMIARLNNYVVGCLDVTDVENAATLLAATLENLKNR